jgi:3',5'-cyclic AMP phosphodiesterase CpdA
MKFIIPAFLLLLISSCSLGVDFAGLFSSYSTPDSRFEEKDSLPYHSDRFTLEAIPYPPGGYQYSLTAISDIHAEDENITHLREFIDDYLQSEDILILDCGDSTDSGYKNQMEGYKTLMDSSTRPWFAALGNHDLYFEGWKSYRTIIGHSVYTFQVGLPGNSGSMLVIALDSANGTLGALQLQWIEELLPEEKNRWDHIIVFTHSQFFSTGITTVVQFTDTEEIYRLMNLFSKNAVDLVLMGHNHQWDDRLIDGVQYLTLDPLQKENSDDSFVRITVDGENLSWQRVMISGN